MSNEPGEPFYAPKQPPAPARQPKPRELLSMIVGAAIGYMATHYLTGSNGTATLIGLVVGGFTPLLVALIRGDDLGGRKQ
jgi:hypothetical protein